MPCIPGQQLSASHQTQEGQGESVYYTESLVKIFLNGFLTFKKQMKAERGGTLL